MKPRRRDRRDRGLRGPLAPAALPLRRTRAQQFDDLVLDAVEALERRWADELRGVEFAVEEVPPGPGSPGRPATRPITDIDPADLDPTDLEGGVRLGRAFPVAGTRPARIVAYRRPIENRAHGRRALGTLVHDVIVEQVAELLGLAPEAIDPDYGPDDDEH